jgi:hypothetical protein
VQGLIKQRELLLAAYVTALDTLMDNMRQRATVQGVGFTSELIAAVKARVDESNEECEKTRRTYLGHLRKMAALGVVWDHC